MEWARTIRFRAEYRRKLWSLGSTARQAPRRGVNIYE